MFNLPLFTAIVVVGVPAFWIIYTCVFLYLSRHYNRADKEE